MTALFIHGADEFRYGDLKSTLAQNMLMCSNQYPWSTEEALNILNIYNQTTRYQKKGKQTKRNDRQAVVAFAQAEKAIGERKDIEDVVCYHARNCEKKTKNNLI